MTYVQCFICPEISKRNKKFKLRISKEILFWIRQWILIIPCAYWLYSFLFFFFFTWFMQNSTGRLVRIFDYLASKHFFFFLVYRVMFNLHETIPLWHVRSFKCKSWVFLRNKFRMLSLRQWWISSANMLGSQWIIWKWWENKKLDKLSLREQCKWYESYPRNLFWNLSRREKVIRHLFHSIDLRTERKRIRREKERGRNTKK